MRNKSDHYQVPAVGRSALRSNQMAQTGALKYRKRLGDYLVEAGLLTKSQVDVALNDQQMTEMKFGEILAARGWVKQQTVEFLMTKVVLPERRAIEQRERTQQQGAEPSLSEPSTRGSSARTDSAQVDSSQTANGQAFARKDVPISKPLPSVKSTDGDVNWVG
jgi:hypothetical protein